MYDKFKTPILLIVFNRPETTKKVFDVVKNLNPQYLFVAADGPRPNNKFDKDRCRMAREVTEQINWTCKVRRLYRHKNLGCGKAVSSAIDWFFKHAASGIILEDDCVPDKSFFLFSSRMLTRYENDPRVMHISGDNFLDAADHSRDDYMLSSYPHVWGWATWKRAWRKYDFTMKAWRQKNFFQKIKFIKGGIWNKLYWISMFDGVVNGAIDTWDFQWIETLMRHKGLSITPGVNLVSNIGFGRDSSHTKVSNFAHSNVKSHSIKQNPRLRKGIDLMWMDKFEEDRIFNVFSYKTVISFVYFSLIRGTMHP